MSKLVLVGFLLGLVFTGPASAAPTQTGAKTNTMQSGKPCMIAASSGQAGELVRSAAIKPTSSPVAAPDVQGVKKPFKLVNTDPGQPTTARPEGDDTLNDRIADANAHNPASGVVSAGSGTSSSSSGIQGSSSGSGRPIDCR